MKSKFKSPSNLLSHLNNYEEDGERIKFEIPRPDAAADPVAVVEQLDHQLVGFGVQSQVIAYLVS